MKAYRERTNLGDLENTVLLGVKSQPTCLISAARIEQCLRGLSEAQREEWREGFCRAEGLSAEPVSKGVLFRRVAARSAEGAQDG